MRFSPASGIALGPILFIVAIIALLAAAIAAGSSAFHANIGTESAKAMAESLLQNRNPGKYSPSSQCTSRAIEVAKAGGVNLPNVKVRYKSTLRRDL